MTFSSLALVVGIGLLGALSAVPARWRAPAVVGELVLGAVFGRAGLGWLDATDPTFAFLGGLGFLLLMYVAGTHVPMRDPELRKGFRSGLGRAAAVGVASAGLGWAVAELFGTGHHLLYAVLFASSSAAVTLPTVRSFSLRGPDVLHLVPQVAVADAVAIITLPLALDPARAGRAALGSVVVLSGAGLVWAVLRRLDRAGWRRRVHILSENRRLALELRVHLLVVLALAALSVWLGVSILLAGFGVGLAVSAIGEPRRLTRQMFGLTEGFLAPVYFVWLGAGLDLGAVWRDPVMLGLGFSLGAGAVLAHLVAVVTRQPPLVAALGASQLGLPAAAVTIGTAQHVLAPGEAAAVLLGAFITIGTVSLAAALLARGASGHGEAPKTGGFDGLTSAS